MLSNSQLKTISRGNPLSTLVIDEASQIELGDYIPVFREYNFSLRKVCFIGDDKQCIFPTFLNISLLINLNSATFWPGAE